MESLPCQSCRGLCCGPVSITAGELKKIKKKIKSMPKLQREKLEQQERFIGTCIFYDLDHHRCGIYSARPEVCWAFGQHSNMPCFRNPNAASKGPWQPKEAPVGTLSIDFTWKDF